MIIEFLYSLFVLLCLLIIFIVLLQKSKGSLGLSGSLGGQAQAMFGGSGGHDFFQKATWVFVACFMGGSLILAIIKNRTINESKYFSGNVAQLTVPMQQQPAPVPVAPVASTESQTTPT